MLIYLDDLIVLSNDEYDGIKNVKAVLDIASQVGLEINWKKCRFLQRRVDFLGHVIGNGTIRSSERKIRAFMQFSEPANVRLVQSFLGLSGYFRKFVPNYSTIARPLSNLLRTDAQFCFGVTAKEAFN